MLSHFFHVLQLVVKLPLDLRINTVWSEPRLIHTSPSPNGVEHLTFKDLSLIFHPNNRAAVFQVQECLFLGIRPKYYTCQSERFLRCGPPDDEDADAVLLHQPYRLDNVLVCISALSLSCLGPDLSRPARALSLARCVVAIITARDGTMLQRNFEMSPN